MLTELYWIDGPWPGRLAVAPRPRGGDWLEDEIRTWEQAGVHAVGSLLTAEEVVDLGLEREPEFCEAAGIAFLSLPIVDRWIPSSDADAARFLSAVHSELNHGKNVVVHCRQGIGRAGLIAAGLLVESGDSPEEALRRVSAARGVSVPETAEQRSWIDSFAATVGHKS